MVTPSNVTEILVPVAMSRTMNTGGRTGHIASLDGKRVGLFWNTKPNGDVLLRTLEEGIRHKHTNTELIWLPATNDTARAAAVVNLEQAKAECDAVIVAVGD